MDSPPRVSLFVTCLVDVLFPKVGESVVRVLRHHGVDVDFPGAQTCCGQPAFNAGFRDEARRVAEHFLEVFESAAMIVCPSGSCASMVKEHYPQLFEDRPALRERFEALGQKTWEFSSFLTEVLGVTELPGELTGSTTWHDCCHSLRGLGIREGPRRLLSSLRGGEFRELEDSETCCGFGGLFSVKFDSISAAMLADKVKHLEACGADRLAATDCSCLMHIAGGLERRGSKVRPMHIAEVLAEALESGGESASSS